MSFSPSWLLLLILIAGLSIGLVWFSSTSFAGALRSVGVPVPYCTFLRPTTIAELDFGRLGPGYFYEANDALAYLSFKPREELLTALCSLSDRGANVRVILSPFLAKDREFLQFLDRCKIKYRSADVLLPNLLVAGRCVFTLGYERDLMVCDQDYASDVRKYLEGIWRA